MILDARSRYVMPFDAANWSLSDNEMKRVPNFVIGLLIIDMHLCSFQWRTLAPVTDFETISGPARQKAA